MSKTNDAYFRQTPYTIRCEWGERGIDALASASDVVVIVDVLSFSTAVDVATARGATVYPYRWKDQAAQDYAEEIGAELAVKRGLSRWSLWRSVLGYREVGAVTSCELKSG